MAVRQQDIASRLGLSISTISLAFQDQSQIAEETRQQVLSLAAELGYVHRPRRIGRSELGQFAFLMPYEASNVFYGAVMHGAESECRRHDIALHYARLDDLTPKRLKQYAEADGLLVVGSVEEATLAQIGQIGAPLVLVDNNLPHLGFDRVLIENVGSIYRVVQKLVAGGHRRIAFACGSPDHPSFAERLHGYRMAITRFGLPAIEFPYVPVAQRIRGTAELIADSADAIGRQFDMHPELPCTALLLCNDLVAIGAMQALQARGIRVPDAISVVGFDDNDMAVVVRPTLTTCHVNRELLGALAVRRLIERIREPDLPTQAWTIDTEFVQRDSVRWLAEAGSESEVAMA